MNKRTVMLEATSRHPSRSEGEEYEAEGRELILDLALRRARTFRPKRETLHLPSEKRIKRKYKRRDMQAE